VGLPCANCDKDTNPQDAKFFGAPGNGKAPPHEAIFVCSECYAMADLFRKRALEQLKSFMTLTEECIRLALIEKRLRLGPLQPQRDLTKREVFESLLHIVEKRDEAREQNQSDVDLPP
jgi:hypothetical protein